MPPKSTGYMLCSLMLRVAGNCMYMAYISQNPCQANIRLYMRFPATLLVLKHKPDLPAEMCWPILSYALEAWARLVCSHAQADFVLCAESMGQPCLKARASWSPILRLPTAWHVQAIGDSQAKPGQQRRRREPQAPPPRSQPPQQTLQQQALTPGSSRRQQHTPQSSGSKGPEQHTPASVRALLGCTHPANCMTGGRLQVGLCTALPGCAHLANCIAGGYFKVGWCAAPPGCSHPANSILSV